MRHPSEAGSSPEAGGAYDGRLSVVIPAYNEELRLGATLDELAEVAGSSGLSIEVVVVDDGSLDATAAVAERHLENFDGSRLIVGSTNRGKGYAVRTGMLAATGGLRMFLDADGSTDTTEIPRFITEIAQSDDDVSIVIASIAVPGATVAAQPGLRPVAGRAGNWLIRALVLPGIRDTQRGFKLFTAAAAESVFSQCVVDGWLFDVEALALGRKLGYTVVELPVRWEHREDSRVTTGSYLRGFVDLFRIRLRLWRRRWEVAERQGSGG